MAKWFARRDKEPENVLTGKERSGEFVEDISGKLERFQRLTRDMRRQWLVNSAMRRGQQFAVLHRNEDRIINLASPLKRKQVMENRIGGWCDHMIANMAMAIPDFEGIPETNDPEAVTSARVASILLKHYWDEWRFLEKYIKICSYTLDFGNAFVFLNAETVSGKYIPVPAIDPMTGKEAVDDNGDIITTNRPLLDITATVLLPHCIVCPLDPNPLEEKEWVIITQKRNIDYFKERYENGGDVSSKKPNTSEFYDIRNASDVSKNSVDAESEVDEIIYMQKPSDSNPDGVLAFIADNTLLIPKGGEEKSKWPYDKLQTYPIEHFHFPQDSGEFFARSRIENQIPLQRSLNLTLSIIMENMDNMGYTKIAIPNQGNIETPADMPEVMRYDYPFKPEYLNPASMPEYIVGSIPNYLRSALMDIQSYHGASIGTSVSGVRSDIHAQNLQEQDLLPLSTLDYMFKDSFERMGEKTLLIAAEKLPDERVITYIGEDKRPMYAKFKASMLGGTHKVRVRMTNIQMRSKAAVTQKIYEFFGAGMITDQYGNPDPVEAMRLLEFALPDSIHKNLKIHSDLAYRENDRLYTGEQTFVLPHQNHNIHINIHQEEQNSPQYMKLYDELQDNQENAEIIQRFNDHVAQHGNMQAQAMGMVKQRPEPKEGEGKTKESKSEQQTSQ